MQPKFESSPSEGNEAIYPREVIDNLEMMLERFIYMPNIPESLRERASLIRSLSSGMARLTEEDGGMDGFDSAQENFFAQLQELSRDEEFWSSFSIIPSDVDSKEVAQTFLSDVDSFLGPAITAEEREKLVSESQQVLDGTPVVDFRNNFQRYVDKLGKVILIGKDSENEERAN